MFRNDWKPVLIVFNQSIFNICCFIVSSWSQATRKGRKIFINFVTHKKINQYFCGGKIYMIYTGIHIFFACNTMYFFDFMFFLKQYLAENLKNKQASSAIRVCKNRVVISQKKYHRLFHVELVHLSFDDLMKLQNGSKIRSIMKIKKEKFCHN